MLAVASHDDLIDLYDVDHGFANVHWMETPPFVWVQQAKVRPGGTQTSVDRGVAHQGGDVQHGPTWAVSTRLSCNTIGLEAEGFFGDG